MLPTKRAIRPALLQALLELGGRARPADTYPRITEAFPDIRPEELTSVLSDGRTNRWHNRIHWARMDLAALGILDASERGIWTLTPGGQALARRGVNAQELERSLIHIVAQEPYSEPAFR